MPAGDAARIAVAEALAQVQANVEGILSAGDPEFVHQFRVGARRLRAFLRGYRKALEPALEDRMRPELAWITAVSGEVRDLDVLAATTLPALARAGAGPAGDRFVRRLALRRAAALHGLRKALASKRHAAMLRAFARWLQSPAADARPEGRDLRHFAARSVERRFRAVRVAAGDDPATLDPAALHRLRIAVKKLRYGIEAFGSLWPAKASRPFEDALAALQASLGRANDAATAARLLATLDAPRNLATFARGWIAAEIAEVTASLPRELAALEAAPRSWKR